MSRKGRTLPSRQRLQECIGPIIPAHPWMPVKHVHLRKRKDPRVLRPHIEAREPEIHAALERGFRDYTMKFREVS